MKQCKLLLVGAIVCGLVPSVSTLAVAQSRSALSIADNDGIFLDGRSFEVIPGGAKGNASAAIEQLGARELGPAAIIFRKGTKLYLAVEPSDQRMYGSDRRDYGSDRDENPSTAQSEREWREWQDSLRQERRNSRGDRRDYGSDRRDYGSDRDESVSAAQAERDWREWQESLRQERNQRSSRGGRRDYGSDRRDYGSDRDESPSTAQSEREWREWQDSLRQNPNPRERRGDRRDHGRDRDADYASDRGAYGGSNRSDCDSDRRSCGSDHRYYGSDTLASASNRLRKLFDENWTTNDTR
jgi:hypothetical protein